MDNNHHRITHAYERRRRKESVMRAATAQQVQPQWLRYPEAERYSGLGRSTLFGLIQSGEIQAAKVGKAVRLSRSSIDEYMEEHSFVNE